MITELSREDLILKGARLRAANLVEQAGYTLASAEADGQALLDLLPKGFLDEAKAALVAVTTALRDRALARDEAIEATGTHHTAFAEAKVWRRTLSHRACAAAALGKRIPEGLLHVSKARTAPELAVQAHEMVKLAEANRDAFPGAGVDELIARGDTLVATLQSFDADKEVKRLNTAPAALQDFYYQKGLLYVALKTINHTAQALHADDVVAAARYNMGLLHARHSARKPEPTPAPQPAPVGA